MGRFERYETLLFQLTWVFFWGGGGLLLDVV